MSVRDGVSVSDPGALIAWKIRQESQQTDMRFLRLPHVEDQFCAAVAVCHVFGNVHGQIAHAARYQRIEVVPALLRVSSRIAPENQ